jgi:hypothetical protein
MLAVTTPGGEELDQYEIELSNCVFEIISSQNGNTILDFVGSCFTCSCVLSCFIFNNDDISLSEYCSNEKCENNKFVHIFGLN